MYRIVFSFPRIHIVRHLLIKRNKRPHIYTWNKTKQKRNLACLSPFFFSLHIIQFKTCRFVYCDYLIITILFCWQFRWSHLSRIVEFYMCIISARFFHLSMNTLLIISVAECAHGMIWMVSFTDKISNSCVYYVLDTFIYKGIAFFLFLLCCCCCQSIWQCFSPRRKTPNQTVLLKPRLSCRQIRHTFLRWSHHIIYVRMQQQQCVAHLYLYSIHCH